MEGGKLSFRSQKAATTHRRRRIDMFKSVIFGAALGGGLLFVVAEPMGLAAPEPHRPPQAAIDACQGKDSGDRCDIALPDRTISGTCTATSESALACRPDHPPAPPSEMTQACAGKSDGDSCVAINGQEHEDGFCRKGPSGALVCLP
jgi:hypothetical protein